MIALLRASNHHVHIPCFTLWGLGSQGWTQGFKATMSTLHALGYGCQGWTQGFELLHLHMSLYTLGFGCQEWTQGLKPPHLLPSQGYAPPCLHMSLFTGLALGLMWSQGALHWFCWAGNNASTYWRNSWGLIRFCWISIALTFLLPPLETMKDRVICFGGAIIQTP